MNPLDNITVVLVEPSTPGNIGATARVLKNTGISHLALVNPCPFDTPEAGWLAHGSQDILDNCTVHENLPDAIARAQIVVGTTHRLRRMCTVHENPRHVIASLAAKVHNQRLAVVFGREKDGLWRRELQYCHHLVRFPTAVSHPSLNLSQAVLLFAYELFWAISVVEEAPSREFIEAGEKEYLFRHMSQALELIEFRPHNDNPTNFERVLRRFFNRTPLERPDALVVHKICGQIKKFARRYKPS